MPCLSETRRFLQSSLFWKARCTLIGLLSSALWLAEYLKHVTEMLHPLSYCDVDPSQNTGTTRQNILWCPVSRARHCIMLRKHKTMSAFVIGETTNNKPTLLLKTRVWIINGKFFKYENILTGCESKQPAHIAHTQIFGLKCSGTVMKYNLTTDF